MVNALNIISLLSNQHHAAINLLMNCSCVTSPVWVSWDKTLKNPETKKNSTNVNIFPPAVVNFWSLPDSFCVLTFIFCQKYMYCNMLSILSLTHPCWSLPYGVAYTPGLPLGWRGRCKERKTQCCYSSPAPEAGRNQKAESRPATFLKLYQGNTQPDRQVRSVSVQ